MDGKLQFGRRLCAAVGVFVLSIVLLSGLTHAQTSGSVVLTGRIGTRLNIQAGEFEAPATVTSFGSRLGPERVSFRFHVRENSATQVLTVPLLLRSNAEFCLNADIAGNSQGVQIEISSPEPSGDGARVMPAALSSFMSGRGLSRCADSIAGGGRISAGGTDQTPDNAIRTILRILVPPSSDTRDFTIELQMQPQA